MIRCLAMIVLGVAALSAAMPLSRAEEPQRGGTLNVLVEPEPPSLMLGLNQGGPTLTVGGKIYEALLTYEFDLTPRPWLARSWSVSADGLTYTFELQEDVRWHDGVPFTAHDVVFTVETFLPETSPRARGLFGQVVSVTAVDDHTVRFKLDEPFFPFIYGFDVSTVPIVPKHIYEGTDFWNNPSNATPIGTGPFKFAEWARGSHIRLGRNEDYWQDGKPYLDEVYFHVIPDASSRAIALETGTVDVLRSGDIEYFDINRLADLPGIEMTTKGWEIYSPVLWLQLNLRIPPFDDARFRQALMHAIDRAFIRDTIFFGFGRVASGPIASTTLFHDPTIPRYEYDLDKARALLEEIGLGPGGKPTTVDLLLMPGEAYQRLGEYLRQQLAKLGIDVRIEAADRATWAQRLGSFDFEMTFNILSQLGDPALGVARNYVSSNILEGTPFGNNGGYVNPRVDALFEAAATAAPATERQRLYSEIQRILIDDVPVIWLLEREYATLYRDHVHNLVTTTLATNETFADVYIAR
ncbi:MAG TPA: ABC transporter substrate-binding protein [Alphaproteobacteria bacterium]|nr:ABC transporter substrate-binding protein [Alphaproteobacteria bacterium]